MVETITLVPRSFGYRTRPRRVRVTEAVRLRWERLVRRDFIRQHADAVILGGFSREMEDWEAGGWRYVCRIDAVTDVPEELLPVVTAYVASEHMDMRPFRLAIA